MKLIRFALIYLGVTLVMTACASSTETLEPPLKVPSQLTVTPDWFSIEMVDVQTGKTFSMNDYAGKVILLETMAIWCPNCVIQATQVEKLHEALGNPGDLISVTLDVDSHEDDSALKEYASSYRFNWHFAVAPLLVERALGNLYSAEYLNPPLSPMLVIDRVGGVHQLKYGIKEVDELRKIVEPYLAQ